MKNRIAGLAVSVLLINMNVVALGSGSSAMPALQQSSQTNEIERLKQAIEKLEEADKDPTIPDDVKQINRRYLQQRRSELETFLNNRIAGLRRYLEVVGEGLDENQRKEIEGLIRAAEQDLAKLKGGSSAPITPGTRNTDVPRLERVDQPEANPTDGTRAPRVRPPASGTPSAPAVRPSSPSPASKITVKDCAQLDANPDDYSLYEKYVCRAVKNVRENKKGKQDPVTGEMLDPDPTAGFSGQEDFAIGLALIALRDNPTYLTAAEEARTDKQVGGGPQNEGSTSLVVKGSAPTFLGMAVENGALTQSISGTTITFRGNPVGIIQALANKGYLQSYKDTEDNTFLRVLRPLSFSFSFDTSRGNTQTNTSPGSMPPSMPNVFTADRQQLSQITARYEFFNQRDPRNKKYRKDWEAFLAGPAISLTRDVSEFFRTLLNGDPALDQWYTQADAAVQAATPDNVEAVIKQQIAQLPINDLSPTTIENLKNLEQSFEGYLTARKDLLDKIARGGIVAFEYTNTRNVEGPNLSNFMVIAEKGAGGNVDATFNGSLTIFDKIPMGMTRRVRDFSFAGQVDAKVGNILNSGDLFFFASGRYERLLEDATDPMGMTVMDTKGNIAVGQIGIKIPVKGTGFRIPISFSFANRTELIKEKEVRGNIGFTFDLDALFSNIKP